MRAARRHLFFVVFVSVMLAATFGCAELGFQTSRIHDEGVALMAQGRYEEGITKLEQALKENSRDFTIRADLINLREQALNQLLVRAAAERAGGNLDAAAQTYQRVLRLDAANERARAGLAELSRDRRHADIVREAKEVWSKGNTEGAWSRLQTVLKENPANQPAKDLKRQIEDQRARELASIPTLESMYKGRPINIDFREAMVRQIFEALSRESGVTFVFDKDVRPDLRASLVARQTSFEDAVNLILMTNQLEKKILNRNTVLIYPATPPKLREYQDLVVKGFYLTYADVKQMQNLIRSVIKTKDMFIDEKMNFIVLRDTPDAIRLAEKLVAMYDLVAPEVMLEVEVLEVQRNRLLEMGIQWPNQMTLTPLPSSGDTLTLRDLNNITSATTGVTISSAILNLRREGGAVNLLANPRIRSQNREKARVLIGDKVPVITTTATSTGFASQSVQYLDVGLKLEVEPSIYLQDEIAIKVSLEVSNIVREILTAGGVLTYQIGSRSAAAALRLKDGETQVLAGLITDQDRRTASGVPGLGDLPVAGRLFRSQKDDTQKTEIVLSITPRLIRNVTLPDATVSEFLSGTETTLRSPRPFGAVASTETQQLASAKPGAVPASLSAGAATTAVVAGVNLAWNGPQQAKVGEQFKVAVVVKSTTAIRSFPLQLGFDAGAMEVVEVSEGSFFRQGSSKSSFANNVDAAGGRLFIGASSAEAGGASGAGELVTVTFRAKSPRPKAELRVLSVSALGPAGAAANVTIPSPLVISIQQ